MKRPRTHSHRRNPTARRQEGGRARTGEGGRAEGSKSSTPPHSPPPVAQKACRPHLQDIGDKGRLEDQPGTPRKGQEKTGCPAPRDQTDADRPPPRVRPVLNRLARQGQEEEEEEGTRGRVKSKVLTAQENKLLEGLKMIPF